MAGERLYLLSRFIEPDGYHHLHVPTCPTLRATSCLLRIENCDSIHDAIKKSAALVTTVCGCPECLPNYYPFRPVVD